VKIGLVNGYRSVRASAVVLEGEPARDYQFDYSLKKADALGEVAAST
jgi:hypothetical protein